MEAAETAAIGTSFVVGEDLAIARDAAAEGGERLFTGRVERAGGDDGLQFEAGLALDQLLDALGIVDAGHLDQNLVILGAPVKLNGRFGDAKRVDSLLDDRARLFGGLAAEEVGGRFIEVEGNTGRIGRGRDIPDVTPEDGEEFLTDLGVGVGALGLDDKATVGRGLDVSKSDRALLQFIDRLLTVSFGDGLNVVVGLHLHHQVGSAAEVESEPNILGKVLPEPFRLEEVGGFAGVVLLLGPRTKEDGHTGKSRQENDDDTCFDTLFHTILLLPHLPAGRR